MNLKTIYSNYLIGLENAWLNHRLIELADKNTSESLPNGAKPKPTAWMARVGLHLLVLWAMSSLSALLAFIPLLGGSTLFSAFLAIVFLLLAWWGVEKRRWKLRSGIDEGLLSASIIFLGQAVIQLWGYDGLKEAYRVEILLSVLTLWSYFTGMRIHAVVMALAWMVWFWWKQPTFIVAVPTLLIACWVILIWLNQLKNWPSTGRAFWLEGWLQVSILVGPLIPVIGLLIDETYSNHIGTWIFMMLVPIFFGWMAWNNHSFEGLIYACAGIVASLSWMNGHFQWMEWDLWTMLLSGISLAGLIALLFRLKEGPWFWLSDKETSQPEMTTAWNLWLAGQHHTSSSNNGLFDGGNTGGGGASSDY